MFAFNAIALATKNFSDENKLGQGGFGCVYEVSAPFPKAECGKINVNVGSISRASFVSLCFSVGLKKAQ